MNIEHVQEVINLEYGRAGGLYVREPGPRRKQLI